MIKACESGIPGYYLTLRNRYIVIVLVTNLHYKLNTHDRPDDRYSSILIIVERSRTESRRMSADQTCRVAIDHERFLNFLPSHPNLNLGADSSMRHLDPPRSSFEMFPEGARPFWDYFRILVRSLKYSHLAGAVTGLEWRPDSTFKRTLRPGRLI